MASALYPLFKQKLLSGDNAIDFDADTIKIRLVNTGTDYTYSTLHDFIDDVAAYSGTTDQTLGSKTLTNGVFDAADAVFSSVAIDGAKNVDAIVVYKDTGTPATSPVIAYLEFSAAKTPNGGDIDIAFNASGLFAL